MKIYLSLKITDSCITSSSLSRTSDGWYYSQTDSTTYEGPYISSNFLLVNQGDIDLIKKLIATKMPKNSSGHDWVYNTEDDVESISYSDCGLCNDLNNFVKGKYPIEFVPSNESQPYSLLSVLNESTLQQTKEFLKEKELLTKEFENKLAVLEYSYNQKLIDYYKDNIYILKDKELIDVRIKLPNTNIYPLDIAFINKDLRLIKSFINGFDYNLVLYNEALNYFMSCDYPFLKILYNGSKEGVDIDGVYLSVDEIRVLVHIFGHSRYQKEFINHFKSIAKLNKPEIIQLILDVDASSSRNCYKFNCCTWQALSIYAAIISRSVELSQESYFYWGIHDSSDSPTNYSVLLDEEIKEMIDIINSDEEFCEKVNKAHVSDRIKIETIIPRLTKELLDRKKSREESEFIDRVQNIYFHSKYDKGNNFCPSFSQIVEFAKLAVYTYNSEIAFDVCDSLLKVGESNHLENLELLIEVTAQAVSSKNCEAAFVVCRAIVEQYCPDKVEDVSK